MFGRFEELIVVLSMVLLLFGAKKLLELAQASGQPMREIRKGFNGDDKSYPSAKNDHTS